MKYFASLSSLLVVSLATTILLVIVLKNKNAIKKMANQPTVAMETDGNDDKLAIISAKKRGNGERVAGREMKEPGNEVGERVARDKRRDNAKRVNVILLSQPRSGSSFTGDIFNHHPDVFYLYEPLHNFNKSHPQATKEEYNKMALNLLRDVFNCRVTDHGLFNELVIRQTLMQWQSALLVPLAERTNKTWKYKFPPAVFGRNIQEACKDHHITVAKILTGRLPSIAMDSLVSLCNTDEFECFIIHLVRDPRAVMRSLLNLRFFGADKITASLLKEHAVKKCREIEENINSMQQLPVFLRNRSVRLHYEYLVENPDKVVRDLFDMIDLHFVESVKEWLNKSTNPPEFIAKKNKASPLSTVKNSKQVMNEWRLDSTSLFIEIVESVCGPLMDTLGYLKTNGSKEKLRDLRIPLFLRNVKTS